MNDIEIRHLPYREVRRWAKAIVADARIGPLLDQLPERHALVIRQLAAGKSRQAIGREQGYPWTRIEQIRQTAVRKLIRMVVEDYRHFINRP